MTEQHRAVYTHGHHESVLRGHRRRTAQDSAGYLLTYLRPGLSVLDIGCGPGTITVDLAARVAPGSVTAVEITDEALDLARAEAQTRNASNVSFVDLRRACARLSRRRVRCRSCPPGAAARGRSGAGAAGDAPGVRPGWDRRGPRRRLRRVHLVSRGLRRWTVGSSCTNGPRAPMAANRMRAGACCPGPGRPASSTSRRPAACGATRRTRPATGGVGMWADRILQSDLARQLVDSGLATSAELEEISAAWREWAAAPDGWFGHPQWRDSVPRLGSPVVVG